MPDFAIRPATVADVSAIRAIYNHYIATSTCTYQVEPESEAADGQSELEGQRPEERLEVVAAGVDRPAGDPHHAHSEQGRPDGQQHDPQGERF